jgi:hypothetical protein
MGTIICAPSVERIWSRLFRLNLTCDKGNRVIHSGCVKDVERLHLASIGAVCCISRSLLAMYQGKVSACIYSPGMCI